MKEGLFGEDVKADKTDPFTIILFCLFLSSELRINSHAGFRYQLGGEDR
jgi:hypothetical protein